MANFFTPLLGLTKQITGENDELWGDTLNSGFIGLAETAIAGREEVDVSAGTVTLTREQGAPDDSRAMILIINGAPAAARTVIVPTLQKMYLVSNESGQDVTIRTTLGSGVTISDGVRSHIYVDQALDQVFDVTLGTGGGGATYSPYSSDKTLVASDWVDDAFPSGPTVSVMRQGNMVNFAVPITGSNFSSTRMVLEPVTGTFPHPPLETMDFFEFIEEGITMTPAYARIAIDGSNVEWFKMDGTLWTSPSFRSREKNVQHFIYSIADLP